MAEHGDRHTVEIALCRGRGTWATVQWGLGSGVSDIAVSRRTGMVWLSGAFLTKVGGDAAVWLYRERRSRDDDDVDDVRFGGALTHGSRRI